jgi:hypothetical protein
MTTDYSKIIQEIAQKENAPILHIAEYGCKNVYDFDIDCSDLQDYNFSDIRKAPEHEELFKNLARIKGPVLYVFEIVSETTSDTIVETIKKYSNDDKSKAIPAIKNTYPNTKILYVGKVNKIFWGRIIQHLGYYKVEGTQGLQLFYWARPLKLKLRLKAMEFENDAIDLMAVFERNLADRLNPILGKHK